MLSCLGVGRVQGVGRRQPDGSRGASPNGRGARWAPKETSVEGGALRVWSLGGGRQEWLAGQSYRSGATDWGAWE